MSDLVGNPEDMFSHNEAYLINHKGFYPKSYLFDVHSCQQQRHEHQYPQTEKSHNQYLIWLPFAFTSAVHLCLTESVSVGISWRGILFHSSTNPFRRRLNTLFDNSPGLPFDIILGQFTNLYVSKKISTSPIEALKNSPRKTDVTFLFEYMYFYCNWSH